MFNKIFLAIAAITVVNSNPCKPKVSTTTSVFLQVPQPTVISVPTYTDPEPTLETPQEDPRDDRYWNNGCAAGGTSSTNEFGANICEYPSPECTVKYFVYPAGGGGVELCCALHSECNYDPVKNYCNPSSNRCEDGSYHGCSEKAGPLFDKCK